MPGTQRLWDCPYIPKVGGSKHVLGVFRCFRRMGVPFSTPLVSNAVEKSWMGWEGVRERRRGETQPCNLDKLNCRDSEKW